MMAWQQSVEYASPAKSIAGDASPGTGVPNAKMADISVAMRVWTLVQKVTTSKAPPQLAIPANRALRTAGVAAPWNGARSAATPHISRQLTAVRESAHQALWRLVMR
mmetsp:Transcript_20367/g.47510  ORF Transcript_20367/g.47510 Transcript_20367/m.47510 type:complete len:107 (-) Transcript_20367:50-370(-)